MKENGSPISQHSSGDLSRAAFLISGYIRKTLTQAEHDELDEWVAASDDNMKLFEELTDESNMEQNLSWLNQFNKEKALEKLKENIAFTDPGKPVINFKWWKWAAAAAFLIVAATSVIFRNRHEKNPESQQIAQDIPPGGNNATITLSDGSMINLTAAQNGILKTDHAAQLVKLQDGQIMYSPLTSDSLSRRGGNSRLTTLDSLTNVPLTNLLSTPKGGQYMITLSDGTKVWLNAESSLKYPLNFQSKQRVVGLKGEGYFEVAKDATRPFKVLLSDSIEVQVLGTHFNVMSYSDEPSKEITLLEGSVRVSKIIANSQPLTATLKPGDKNVIQHLAFSIQHNIDTSATVAWKNNQFVFHDEQISFIMRQLQRWYNFETKYQLSTSDHFNATIERNEPLSKILQYLEATGKIHFKIENRIVYVLP